MRVTVDASKTLASLLKARDEIKLKLENMVIGFTLDIVNVAIRYTPKGDYVTYEDLYRRRSELYPWLPDGPYLAVNSYDVKISEDFAPIRTQGKGWAGVSFRPVIGGSSLELGNASGSASISRVEGTLNAGFELGQQIRVFNNAPYVNHPNALGDSLESGYSKQAPEGIKSPTIDTIAGYYRSIANLKSHYMKA